MQTFSLWLGILRLTGGLAAIITSCLSINLVTAQDVAENAIERLTTDITYLASDELAGRDVGSPGIAAAGAYIAQRFDELGLETNAFDGSPYQEFTIPGPATVGSVERNQLRFLGVPGLDSLTLGRNYTPVSLGCSGSFAGSVVFAGYGITAPELQYDDYAQIDVKGKVVIVLRKEPGQEDPNSRFDGQRPSQHAFFSSKELNASVHGAAGMIIVNDGVTVRQAGEDQLPALTAAGSSVTEAQIPTVYCLRSVVDSILQASSGQTLEQLELAIEQQTEPHSQALTGIECHGEVLLEQSQTPVRNVVGVLPGQGALATETLVIGAHYDHVGMGGVGSLAPGTIEIHNGADDNASGTTVLLEVARRLTSALQEGAFDDHREIVFIAFTGEERGLLGSKYYVRNPRWPLEKTVAMLNMDMVGRMQGNSLTVYGTGTAAQFDGLVERVGQALQLAIDKQPAGFGPSDHSSFYEVNIPVMHFFTGLHNDYHRPSDDVDKANLRGMAAVSDMVTAIALEIAGDPDRPQLIQSSAVAQIGRDPAPPRAVLGVRLEAANAKPRVVDVMRNSPAAAAGMQIGDVINAVDGQAMDSIDALHRCLAERKPGDIVSITILRDVNTRELSITLQ